MLQNSFETKSLTSIKITSKQFMETHLLGHFCVDCCTYCALLYKYSLLYFEYSCELQFKMFFQNIWQLLYTRSTCRVNVQNTIWRNVRFDHPQDP